MSLLTIFPFLVLLGLTCSFDDFPDDFEHLSQLQHPKLRSRSEEALMDDLETALDLKEPDVVSVLLGNKHQVHIPEALVAHICMRKWLTNLDQVLFRYRTHCPNLDSGDVSVACYLGHLAVHNVDVLTRNKTLRVIISKCQMWYQMGSDAGKLGGRKETEMGRCLSKLVSKSCDVNAFIQQALRT